MTTTEATQQTDGLNVENLPRVALWLREHLVEPSQHAIQSTETIVTICRGEYFRDKIGELIIPALLEFLGRCVVDLTWAPDAQLVISCQVHALRALCNLMFNSVENQKRVGAENGVNLISPFLSDYEQPKLQRYAAIAIANMCFKCPSQQMECGSVIFPLILLCDSPHNAVACMAVRALCNIADQPCNTALGMEGGIGQKISKLLSRNDVEVQLETLGLLSRFTKVPQYCTQLLSKGIIDVLVAVGTQDLGEKFHNFQRVKLALSAALNTLHDLSNNKELHVGEVMSNRSVRHLIRKLEYAVPSGSVGDNISSSRSTSSTVTPRGSNSTGEGENEEDVAMSWDIPGQILKILRNIYYENDRVRLSLQKRNYLFYELIANNKSEHPSELKVIAADLLLKVSSNPRNLESLGQPDKLDVLLTTLSAPEVPDSLQFPLLQVLQSMVKCKQIQQAPAIKFATAMSCALFQGGTVTKSAGICLSILRLIFYLHPTTLQEPAIKDMVWVSNVIVELHKNNCLTLLGDYMQTTDDTHLEATRVLASALNWANTYALPLHESSDSLPLDQPCALNSINVSPAISRTITTANFVNKVCTAVLENKCCEEFAMTLSVLVRSSFKPPAIFADSNRIDVCGEPALRLVNVHDAIQNALAYSLRAPLAPLVISECKNAASLLERYFPHSGGSFGKKIKSTPRGSSASSESHIIPNQACCRGSNKHVGLDGLPEKLQQLAKLKDREDATSRDSPQPFLEPAPAVRKMSKLDRHLATLSAAAKPAGVPTDNPIWNTYPSVERNSSTKWYSQPAAAQGGSVNHSLAGPLPSLLPLPKIPTNSQNPGIAPRPEERTLPSLVQLPRDNSTKLLKPLKKAH
ncbi:hypothetical protein Pelo_11110 [Pelomyxa schiedti]|nr:hypothetical protein Pelo_11110 [Pelomyxa schiedti]